MRLACCSSRPVLILWRRAYDWIVWRTDFFRERVYVLGAGEYARSSSSRPSALRSDARHGGRRLARAPDPPTPKSARSIWIEDLQPASPSFDANPAINRVIIAMEATARRAAHAGAAQPPLPRHHRRRCRHVSASGSRARFSSMACDPPAFSTAKASACKPDAAVHAADSVHTGRGHRPAAASCRSSPSSCWPCAVFSKGPIFFKADARRRWRPQLLRSSSSAPCAPTPRPPARSGPRRTTPASTRDRHVSCARPASTRSRSCGTS